MIDQYAQFLPSFLRGLILFFIFIFFLYFILFLELVEKGLVDEALQITYDLLKNDISQDFKDEVQGNNFNFFLFYFIYFIYF